MADALRSFAGTYAKEFMQITWSDDGFSDMLNNGEKQLQEKIQAILERNAPEIEGHMKVNAPWDDQTTNARNGLAAQAYHQGDERGIVLFHQVPYGIWLEVKYSGRYAIIMPTIEEYGPRVMQECTNLLGKRA